MTSIFVLISMVAVAVLSLAFKIEKLERLQYRSHRQTLKNMTFTKLIGSAKQSSVKPVVSDGGTFKHHVKRK